MTNQQKEKAAQYFEAYPKAEVIYETSDGQVFLDTNHSDAVNHQKHLTLSDPTAKLQTYYKRDLSKKTDEQVEEEDLEEDGEEGKE